MHKSRKRKLRRFESKYRSFNFRTIIAYLVLAFILYLGGLSFSPEPNSLEAEPEVSPILYFAFIWTGFICLQLSGQFVVGTLRAHAEKKFGALMWQFVWAAIFIVAGISVAVFGVQGYLV